MKFQKMCIRKENIEGAITKFQSKRHGQLEFGIDQKESLLQARLIQQKSVWSMSQNTNTASLSTFSVFTLVRTRPELFVVQIFDLRSSGPPNQSRRGDVSLVVLGLSLPRSH